MTTTPEDFTKCISTDVFDASPDKQTQNSLPFQSKITRNLATRSTSGSIFRSLSDRTVNRRGRKIHLSNDENRRKAVSQDAKKQKDEGNIVTLQSDTPSK